MRWLAVLTLFHFTVKHVPGSANTADDALSRRDEVSLNLLAVDVEPSWEEAYRQDTNLGPLYFDSDQAGVAARGPMLNETMWYHGRFDRRQDCGP